MTRLSRSFFERHTLDVAPDLLGKVIVFKGVPAMITETEAYREEGDAACHAARGRTPRNLILFGPAGHVYVYFIYGMYYCMNFVTEVEGFGSGVLIRGVKLLNEPYTHLNGPGKLCRYFGITRAEHNGIDLISSPELYVEDRGYVYPYQTTPRIGIRQAQDLLWRFVIDPALI